MVGSGPIVLPSGFPPQVSPPCQGAAAPHSHSRLFLALFSRLQLKNLFLTFSWGRGARAGRGGQERLTRKGLTVLGAPDLGRAEPGAVPSPGE